MLNQIKSRIENELGAYLQDLDRKYSLGRLSPVLYRGIREFVLRKGKRIRPLLFVIGYRGFAGKSAPKLYTGALALELLHSFILAHDDIVDRSELRRGRPSLHKMFSRLDRRIERAKFDGEDLALITGDIMYALAIKSFLSVGRDPRCKEKALDSLLEAAIYTGTGEFLELMYGVEDLEKIAEEDIYRVYEFKTALYTFACPLAAGAILAGAGKREVSKLYEYGRLTGKAFQIKDDILSLFSGESETGKSTLSDLLQARVTLLILTAFRNSSPADRSYLKKLLMDGTATRGDLRRVRALVRKSGALDYARRQISVFSARARKINSALRMRPRYRHLLDTYSEELLRI